MMMINLGSLNGTIDVKCNGVDGALEKEEGLSTCSEFFSLVLLATE